MSERGLNKTAGFLQGHFLDSGWDGPVFFSSREPIMAAKAANHIVQAACQEVTDVCAVLLMLGGEQTPIQSTIDAVMSARSGVRERVRQAISLNSWWRSQEKIMKQRAVSWLSYKPELDVANKGIDSMPIAELLGRVCKRVPLWLDGLLPGIAEEHQQRTLERKEPRKASPSYSF